MARNCQASFIINIPFVFLKSCKFFGYLTFFCYLDIDGNHNIKTGKKKESIIIESYFTDVLHAL